MPQLPNLATVFKALSGAQTQPVLDAQGNIPVNDYATVNPNAKSTFNITAATVIKAAPGRILRLSVIVAGSAAGTINDCTTTGAAAVGNQIGVIPNTAGVLAGFSEVNFLTGIVVVPGTGQTLAVSYL